MISSENLFPIDEEAKKGSQILACSLEDNTFSIVSWCEKEETWTNGDLWYKDPNTFSHYVPLNLALRSVEMRELLDEWNEISGMESERCRRDHHGYCQSHFLQKDCIAVRTENILNETE